MMIVKLSLDPLFASKDRYLLKVVRMSRIASEGLVTKLTYQQFSKGVQYLYLQKYLSIPAD